MLNKVASQTEVRKVYVKKTVNQDAAREKWVNAHRENLQAVNPSIL